MAAKKRRIQLHEQVLWSAADVAAAFHLDPSGVSRMARRGMLPPHITTGEYGGAKRWARAEIIDWAHCGCPDPQRWRWHPRRVPDLEEYVARLRAEASLLEQKISALTKQVNEQT
jgi:hypothetical protein